MSLNPSGEDKHYVYETTPATYTFHLPLHLRVFLYRGQCSQYKHNHAEDLRFEANDKAVRELHALLRDTKILHGPPGEVAEESMKNIWQQNIAGLSRKTSKWVNESGFVRFDRENGRED
ncbi:MAG: hypothetical protein L6R38_006021 [Xanthoria sp. 2 TBL-2021]|nr:MAG: hypothetical protein L6R38_006021 [Xanthoria sp. 2 TBL-2021]